MQVYYCLFIWLVHVWNVRCTSVPRRLEEIGHVTIRLPGYTPQMAIGFEPIAESSRVHHILIYGCRKPFKENGMWKGGETCMLSGQILYAWGRNALPLFLPSGVGFSVGHETDSVKYIVMQVHYAMPFKGKILDYTGVKLHFTEEQPSFLASVYLFVSERSKIGIKPGVKNFAVNISCIYNGAVPLYPFAFRVHTHGMGRVVSAALKNESGWTVIGKSNPQWPQLFNPVKSFVIKNQDLLAAKCIFDSRRQNKTVYIGSTGSDEMCNFYMMYYREVAAEDPFPNGAVCNGNDEEAIVEQEYPISALQKLPSRPELEEKAGNFLQPFGITDGIVLEKSIAGETLGQVSGLAFDSSGRLVVFHRAERKWTAELVLSSNILIPTVCYFVTLRFYLPHGIHISSQNEYFTTDVGSQLITKWKISKDGLREIFHLGEKFVSGNDREHFCLPTSVVTSPVDGSIYVSDGYCNSRVIKFTKDGKYVTEWTGTFGRGTMSYSVLPHDISINDDGTRIYVSDRQNARVQVFDSNGRGIGEISNFRNKTLFHSVYSAHYKGGHVYFISGVNGEGQIFCAKSDILSVMYSYVPSKFYTQMAHIIRVSPDGQYIYVGEISDSTGGRVLQVCNM
uniref:Peptidylglycine monooxygenase n=1 Tax=Syphacia muris TaxID=451379 RepID=A0A0N5AQP0_9BILA